MLDLAGKPVGVVQAVNKRSGAFVSSDEALIQLLSDQAGVAFQRYNLQQEAIQEAKRATSFQREMELALDVQQAMIPDEAPKIPGIEAAGYTRAASITGGDCYDLWRTADGRLGIFVGDATGHGIGPAMVVSQTRTLVRAMCNRHPDPRELLDRCNARLHEDLEAGKFVTAFLGFLAPDGNLEWCSAGHGPILLRPGGNQPIQSLDANAPPLGIMGEFLSDETAVTQFAPGGMICVTSDGIAEAFAPNDEQFGAERLIEILTQSNGAPGEQVIARVQQAVRQWQQKDEPKDDQTMVVATRVL
jgi:phosphoserine phosphatase